MNVDTAISASETVLPDRCQSFEAYEPDGFVALPYSAHLVGEYGRDVDYLTMHADADMSQ
jgi:hypothetical protein